MRPERVVLVCGTGTEVGKTWVACRLLRELRRRGATVSARKPAQSFDIDSAGTPLGGPTDAEQLAEASGEDPARVCHPFRSYHRAMAPPMAAEALGLDPFTIADLVDELAWPVEPVDVGVVELAGGVRSPQADDGDSTQMLAALEPDLVVLVADAGLGTVNAVRLSMDALESASSPFGSLRTVVVLDRFDAHHGLHCRNREWLAVRCGYEVVTVPGDEGALAGAAWSGTGPA